jgi:flagellar biosynthesis protein FlhF
MSTTAPAPTNGHSKPEDGVRTYRGRKLEDLIPRIKHELGPDAIILREREGLMGGINGFFAQRFIEIEARAGAARIDLYDEEPLDDDTFASQLEQATTPFTDDPRPTPATASVPPAQNAGPAPSDPHDNVAPELPEPQQRDELGDAIVALEADDVLEPIAAEPLPTVAPEIAQVPEAARAAEAAPAAGAAPAAEAAPVADTVSANKPAPASAPKPRRRGSKLLGRGSSPAPKHEINGAEAAAVMTELAASGVSPGWSGELIGKAGAHFGPFAQTSLRDAVRGAIAASLVPSSPLPSTGAAIAFVGTGGAGKSRCAATLAAAYRQGSTLPVTVLSLAGPRAARGLADLLKTQGVPVGSVSDGRALARRVEKGRAGGLVVIDTGAAIPSDPAGVTALAAQLAPLSLDAIVLALPATLGAETAKRLLAGLSPLGTTGIAITHIDETNQLGVAIELAVAARMPISYLHEGLDLGSALSAPNPFSLAQRLVP